jgi:hypothetical protein
MKVLASRVGRGSCEIETTGTGAAFSTSLMGAVAAAFGRRFVPPVGGAGMLGKVCTGVAEEIFSAAAKAPELLPREEHESRANPKQRRFAFP